MVSKLKLLLALASSLILSSQAARTTNLDKMQYEIHDAASAHPPRSGNIIPVVEANDLGLKDVPKHDDDKVDPKKQPKVDDKSHVVDSSATNSTPASDDKTTTESKAKTDGKPANTEVDDEFEFIPIVLLRGNRGGLFLFQPFQEGGGAGTGFGLTDEGLIGSDISVPNLNNNPIAADEGGVDLSTPVELPTETNENEAVFDVGSEDKLADDEEGDDDEDSSSEDSSSSKGDEDSTSEDSSSKGDEDSTSEDSSSKGDDEGKPEIYVINIFTSPLENPSEKPVEPPAEKPVEPPTEKPTEKPLV